MKKRTIAVLLLGVMAASAIDSTGVSAASQDNGSITVSYVSSMTQQSTVIESGAGQQVQTGDTSSSAWIYTLAMATSTLAMLAVLFGKKRKEDDDEEENIAVN